MRSRGCISQQSRLPHTWRPFEDDDLSSAPRRSRNRGFERLQLVLPFKKQRRLADGCVRLPWQPGWCVRLTSHPAWTIYAVLTLR
jgi:hypothetical protein